MTCQCVYLEEAQFDPALQFWLECRAGHVMPCLGLIALWWNIGCIGTVCCVWAPPPGAAIALLMWISHFNKSISHINNTLVRTIRRRCPPAAISNLLPRSTSLSRMNNNKGVTDNKMLTLQVFVKQTKNSHQYYLILIFHNKSCEPRQRQRRYIFTLLTFECCWTAERV